MSFSLISDDAVLMGVTNGQTVSRGKYKICAHCHNVKYKKQWYAASSKVAQLARGKWARAERQSCPACLQKISGKYDAELVIFVELAQDRSRVEAFLVREGKEATSRNPQQRIHQILATPEGYEVRLSGIKLMRALSQKLQDQQYSIKIKPQGTTRLTSDARAEVVWKLPVYT